MSYTMSFRKFEKSHRTNFKFIANESGKYYSYYDQENAVSLIIFKSGWNDKYQCIVEWGEYETTDHYLYTVEQIQQYYGISTFLRKEKLDKINESAL